MSPLSAFCRYAALTRPVGTVTRGTTAPNRLRRIDRWTIASYDVLLRTSAAPLVVDLGFGASPVTTVELADRLAARRPGIEVLGLEIDGGRVAAARPFARAGLSFAVGGFEVPAPRAPVLIRALNVLRQYDESEVAGVWRGLRSRLAPGGVLIEGTCDELGRLACWVAVSAAAGPETFTAASRLATLGRPSDLAERLPKCLIHRNVPGEPVHAFFRELDRAWDAHAGLAVFGARQRWVATVASVRAAGWPVLGGVSRWRLGEVTVLWAAVAPA
ncbi:MAG: hypothetical protein QOF57_2836 [Frankiaceae bacterium]|nr:hypothetical protein [Frankiaceae bacterium]